MISLLVNRSQHCSHGSKLHRSPFAGTKSSIGTLFLSPSYPLESLLTQTRYERVAWFPVFVVFLVALGVSGSHLQNTPSTPPATASTILSYGSTIAGFVITYSSLASDFTLYYNPSVPSWRMFSYSYMGFLLPLVTLQSLGAAVASTAPTIPTWQAGYENGNVGGLLLAMLSPTGNFGKFLTVLLSFSVAGNIAATFYSFCFNIQIFVPVFVHVPRYVFSVLATAMQVLLSLL